MSDHSPTPDTLVAMRRPNLLALPALQMPEGYELRAFRTEDEAAWEALVGDAFEIEDREGYFDRRMRHDPDYFDPESILMVWRDDRLIATASAWWRSEFGPEVGYLHMVAVDASERGRGLGYQISLACLYKMAADGRASAVLRTDVKRLPAINIYLKLGFEPWIRNNHQRQAWEIILNSES